jgi:hypothetical protein
MQNTEEMLNDIPPPTFLVSRMNRLTGGYLAHGQGAENSLAWVWPPSTGIMESRVPLCAKLNRISSASMPPYSGNSCAE